MQNNSRIVSDSMISLPTIVTARQTRQPDSQTDPIADPGRRKDLDSASFSHTVISFFVPSRVPEARPGTSFTPCATPRSRGFPPGFTP